jgi:hypothetical protein
VRRDLGAHWRQGLLVAILLGGHHPPHLAAPREQGGEGLAGRSGQGTRRGLAGRGEVRQRRGIERVGLGAPPRRLSEVAHLAGIGHRQWQAGERASCHDQPFPAASGLQHNQPGSQRADYQRGHAGLVSGAAPVLTARAQRHIQGGFAPSDPCEHGWRCSLVGRLHLVSPPLIPAVPALPDSGSNAQAPVRVLAGAWRDDPSCLTVSATQEETAYRATRNKPRL